MTPPTLTLPAATAADATSPAGAAVTFAVTANDPDDGGTAVTCAPPSGTTFAIGDTTVVCTASDTNGNVATGSFTVHVRGAAEQLAALRARVASLTLPWLVARSLDVELHVAQLALAAGRTRVVRSALALFAAEVRALPASLLARAETGDLAAASARIRSVVG